MASVAELDEAVTALRLAGCRDVVLLKCTSTYPASPENSNIVTIPHLRELFGCEVGLSDHTMGIGAAGCGRARCERDREALYAQAQRWWRRQYFFARAVEFHSLVTETHRVWRRSAR